MESIQEQGITRELAAERMKSLQETVVSKASALVEANKQLNEPKGPDGSIRAKYGVYADEMYSEIYNTKTSDGRTNRRHRLENLSAVAWR